MRSSTPIFRLKREARLLARRENIPLHEALDRLAAGEGRRNWSLLMQERPTPARRFYEILQQGDLALIGARPRQGKTLMGLQVLLEALKAGRTAMFFTLEYTRSDVLDRLQFLGFDDMQLVDHLVIDTSEAISAGYIASMLDDAPEGAIAVVDYLQLLDRRRDTPPLAEQMQLLAEFACRKGVILVFLAQIDRTYDARNEGPPRISHVRIAEPFDLKIFAKTCFIQAGKMLFGQR